jgi:hypothetical protein
VIRIAILALGVVAAVLPAARAAAPPASGPKVVVLRTNPLVVRGDKFKSGERVRLVLMTERTVSWPVVANSSGVFTSRPRISLDRCQSFTLHAFGSKGSRARSLPSRSTCGPSTGSLPDR